ncbi:MAG TPA: DNA damage-inducible protein DinB, partial [Ignavibacteriaceae bacterium]
MRPSKNDYAPYYEKYINLIKGEDIRKILAAQSIETQAVLNSFPKAMGDYSYEKGKWTVKEVVGHLIDTERV